MNLEIASKNFLIDAPQERIWRLIGKVIFQSLSGMEEVEILDERNFRAILREKILFWKMNMRLKGEITEITPPECLTANLLIEGMGGIFKINQKVTIKMSPREDGKTSLECRSIAEDAGIIIRLLFFRKAQSIAKSVFETIESRLRDLA